MILFTFKFQEVQAMPHFKEGASNVGACWACVSGFVSTPHNHNNITTVPYFEDQIFIYISIQY
jgi:hypothetical protein